MLFKYETAAILFLSLIGSLSAQDGFNNINNYNGLSNRENEFNNLNPRYNNNATGFNESNPPPPAYYRRHKLHRCQPERFEHQVVMKKYNDSTGYWVLYSQIVETRNVGNKCHKNEYVYLAHRRKAGWFWNPKINSLVQYSLGEPKFVSRRVTRLDRPSVIVNMSRNYAPQSVDLDRLFPKKFADEIIALGGDDLKWSELAKSSLPILQMETAYVQTVIPMENAGSQRIKILNDQGRNCEVLE